MKIELLPGVDTLERIKKRKDDQNGVTFDEIKEPLYISSLLLFTLVAGSLILMA